MNVKYLPRKPSSRLYLPEQPAEAIGVSVKGHDSKPSINLKLRPYVGIPRIIFSGGT